MRGERTTQPVDDRKKTEMPFYERQISPALRRHATEQRERRRRLEAPNKTRRRIRESTKLNHFLKKKYCSTVHGWEALWYKAGLIPEFGDVPAGMCEHGKLPIVETGRAGWGTISLPDFKVAMRREQFPGNVERLWTELDPVKTGCTGLPRLETALRLWTREFRILP